MKLERTDLFEDRTLIGGAFTAAYSERVDEWIHSLAHSGEVPPGVALVAIGGYGRGDLAPQSDLDVALVHEPDVDIAEFADRIWYPIWDSGLKLGHRVDTVDGLLKIARTDLDTATALLSIRLIAGDESIAPRLSHCGAGSVAQ